MITVRLTIEELLELDAFHERKAKRGKSIEERVLAIERMRYLRERIANHGGAAPHPIDNRHHAYTHDAEGRLRRLEP